MSSPSCSCQWFSLNSKAVLLTSVTGTFPAQYDSRTFFNSLFAPIRGKPKHADLTIVSFCGGLFSQKRVNLRREGDQMNCLLTLISPAHEERERYDRHMCTTHTQQRRMGVKNEDTTVCLFDAWSVCRVDFVSSNISFSLHKSWPTFLFPH